MSELNIDILCANTSQAKGRVEGAHHTLQDRLLLNPPSTTLRTIASRPLGAKGAFLWTFIWSLPGTLKLRILSFLGSDQMDNLLKDHS